ncbi:hypothetical protein T484DRAFT_1770836 [Baffinella frigidus]|nr:hypothetical protein T484DRAFT_1770836 [Cryptophyta sp. CCMP2293]
MGESVRDVTERGTLCPPTSTFVSRKPTGAAAMAAPSNPGEVALASALPGKEDCEKNAAAVTPAIASLRPMVRVPALEHRTPSAPTTPLRPGRVLAAAATAPPIEDQARDWCGSGKPAEEENLAAKKDKNFWVRRAATKKALGAITLVALIANVVTSVVGLCDKVDDVLDKTVSALDEELCAASLLIIEDYNAGQRSQTLGSEIGISTPHSLGASLIYTGPPPSNIP